MNSEYLKEAINLRIDYRTEINKLSMKVMREYAKFKIGQEVTLLQHPFGSGQVIDMKIVPSLDIIQENDEIHFQYLVRGGTQRGFWHREENLVD